MGITPGGAQPDWYPDPGDPTQLRYWDGASWSSYVAPRQQYNANLTGTRGSVWWQSWWAIVLGLVLCLPLGLVGLWRRPGLSTRLRAGVTVAVVVLIGGVALAPSDDPAPASHLTASNAPSKADRTPTPSPSASTEPDATPSTEPAPAPTEDVEPVATKPARATVPLVEGMTKQQAAQTLATAGLSVKQYRPVPSDQARGTVIRQGKAEGTTVKAGASVVLIVAAPYPLVPWVVGQAQAAAVSQLEAAGFKATATLQTRTTGPDGVVLAQTPGGSERAKPGSTIAVVVSKLVRPVAPPVSQSCTPGYRPCLPPASDYDCAGGSGNGPAYADGPVYITGSDPYDLDADGDGIACE